MIKLIQVTVLSLLTLSTVAVSAYAEAPSNTQDQHGRVYQDIRNGRYDEPMIEPGDPGHDEAQADEEEVTPPEGCPSDLDDLDTPDYQSQK